MRHELGIRTLHGVQDVRQVLRHPSIGKQSPQILGLAKAALEKQVDRIGPIHCLLKEALSQILTIIRADIELDVKLSSHLSASARGHASNTRVIAKAKKYPWSNRLVF
jgi:hypothetical protein